MDKVLKSGAAEKAPKDIPGEWWYLPLFGKATALTNDLYNTVESHFSSEKEMVCPQQMVLLCYHLKFSQKCHL
jgi:hypothetical protein